MSRDWGWCGMPGHFIGGRRCVFHLTTQVGRYRVSTVGLYCPRDKVEPLGAFPSHLFETMVFKTTDEVDECGVCRVVKEWNPIEERRYSNMGDANRGHLEMCEKYWQIWLEEQKEVADGQEGDG